MSNCSHDTLQDVQFTVKFNEGFYAIYAASQPLSYHDTADEAYFIKGLLERERLARTCAEKT